MAGIELNEKIKAAVAAWREKGYDGASAVTKRLLEFWFKQDHLLKDGSEFRFWRAQREAIAPVMCQLRHHRPTRTLPRPTVGRTTPRPDDFPRATKPFPCQEKPQ